MSSHCFAVILEDGQWHGASGRDKVAESGRVWRWQEGECGELADGINGFYVLLLQEVESFLLAKLTVDI